MEVGSYIYRLQPLGGNVPVFSPAICRNTQEGVGEVPGNRSKWETREEDL